MCLTIQQQTTDYRGGTLSVRVYYNHSAKLLTVEGMYALSIISGGDSVLSLAGRVGAGKKT